MAHSHAHAKHMCAFGRYLPRVSFAVLYASVTLVLPIKDLEKPFCAAVEKPLVDVLRVFRPMQGNEPLRWYPMFSGP